MRRGVGDTCSDGPGAPWSWQRAKYTLAMCNNSYNNAGPMPSPPAPSVSLTSDATAPGAVYAGQDSSGAPVYAVPQTAPESVAATNAALSSYFTTVGNANPPPAAPCTSWYSFLDPTCPSSLGTGLIFVAAAVAGVLVLGVALGGHR